METTREFEWDNDKAAETLANRGIGFATATRVFLDANVVDFQDDRADYREERRTRIGMINNLHYSVTYTMRGDMTRIISARRASQKERRLYHG
jgi:uncharacterized protein